MEIAAYGLTRTDVEAYLHQWGIEWEERRRTSGKVEAEALCPFHQDTGRPNWSVNLQTGFHKCFSCGASGHFVHLFSHMEQVPMWESVLFLRGLATSPKAMRRRLTSAFEHLRQQPQQPPPAPPAHLPPVTVYKRVYHKYLQQRGISEQSFRTWGLRYSSTREAVVIPVYDEHAVLWGYVYRNLRENARTRYLYSEEFHRSELLYGFGLWRKAVAAYNVSQRSLIVVEGSFDAIWLHQTGLPACALLGSFASTRQLQLMREASEVIIMADKDKTGANATVQIAEELYKKILVRVARYPRYANDPSEVRPHHLKLMVSRAVPYVAWKQQL